MKKFYNFLSFTWLVALAILLSTGGVQAQTNVTIGSGTNSSTYWPNYYNFNYSYTQQIVLASEVTSGGWGGGAGLIQKIRFLPGATVSTTNWKDWVIYVGNTSKTSFSSTTDWVPAASMTQVFNGTLPGTVTSGVWMEITLTTPFLYDGTSNIVVAIDENTNTYGNNPSWKGYAPGANRGIYYYSDPTNPDPASPPTATGRNGAAVNVAQMQFEMIANVPCAGMPAPGNTVSSANPVCSGVNFNLSLQNPTSGTGVTYQWQSADDAAFTIGVTNLGTASTQTTSQTTAKYYRCYVTCNNSGMSAYSTALQVTMNSPTYATYNNVSYTESFESWVNGCSTSDRPSASWENSPNTGNASLRRNDQGSTAGWTSPTYGVYSPVFTDGSYSARFHSSYATGGAKGSLSLYINMTAATGNTRLSFDHINTSGTDVLKVFLSTDGGVTFTQQGTDIGISAVWTNKTFDFNSTSATTVIKLEATSDYGSTDIGIDKLKLEPAPACLATTATAASNITATTASANWSTATEIGRAHV